MIISNKDWRVSTMHRCKHIVRGVAAAVLTLTLATGIASASFGTGTVTGSSLRLRSTASTASTTLATVSKGTKVTVLEDAVNGWYKVQYNGKTGYMSADYLTVVASAETETAAAAASEDEADDTVYAQVTASTLNIRSGAGTGYSKVAQLSRGAVVTVLETLDGWTKISTGTTTGYVSSEYLTVVDAATAASASSKAAQLVALAKTYLGVRYKYGGASPSGFDCSGFTYYVFKNSAGVTLPRTATGQYNSGYTKVSKANLQVGDLVFFSRTSGGSTIGHVGIYIGDGKFIHSSSPTSGGVIISALSESYYSARYYGAVRVLS
jgi:cell wall-associated NlpC family hydrolase